MGTGCNSLATRHALLVCLVWIVNASLVEAAAGSEAVDRGPGVGLRLGASEGAGEEEHEDQRIPRPRQFPTPPVPSPYNVSVPFMSFKKYGHSLSGNSSSPNRLDFFIDPFCEESALGAWPTILNLSSHYLKVAPGQLEIRVHVFPLAYTFGSFQTSQALLSVYKLSGFKDNAFFKALSHIWRNPPFGIFEYQDTFANMSKPEMTKFLADDLLPLFPSVSRKDFCTEMETQHLHFNKNDLNNGYWLTKGAWKYATTKGAFGTPTYFLNDVFIPEIGPSVHSQLAWQTPEWWRTQVLDYAVFG